MARLITAFIVLAIAFIIATIRAGLHKISEGNVGVYMRGGALLSSTTGPGYHVMIPFLDEVHEIQVTMQVNI